ncbi:hypothetical protein HDU82_005555 [Entophlyctis luteolus]|nr:hypothetical protein HDU82_005555 [Entophlyctis luteolus]
MTTKSPSGAAPGAGGGTPPSAAAAAAASTVAAAAQAPAAASARVSVAPPVKPVPASGMSWAQKLAASASNAPTHAPSSAAQNAPATALVVPIPADVAPPQLQSQQQSQPQPPQPQHREPPLQQNQHASHQGSNQNNNNNNSNNSNNNRRHVKSDKPPSFNAKIGKKELDAKRVESVAFKPNVSAPVTISASKVKFGSTDDLIDDSLTSESEPLGNTAILTNKTGGIPSTHSAKTKLPAPESVSVAAIEKNDQPTSTSESVPESTTNSSVSTNAQQPQHPVPNNLQGQSQPPNQIMAQPFAPYMMTQQGQVPMYQMNYVSYAPQPYPARSASSSGANRGTNAGSSAGTSAVRISTPNNGQQFQSGKPGPSKNQSNATNTVAQSVGVYQYAPPQTAVVGMHAMIPQNGAYYSPSHMQNPYALAYVPQHIYDPQQPQSQQFYYQQYPTNMGIPPFVPHQSAYGQRPSPQTTSSSVAPNGAAAIVSSGSTRLSHPPSPAPPVPGSFSVPGTVVSAAAPSSAIVSGPIPPPVVKKAIKITNPLTKEEVKFSPVAPPTAMVTSTAAVITPVQTPGALAAGSVAVGFVPPAAAVMEPSIDNIAPATSNTSSVAAPLQQATTIMPIAPPKEKPAVVLKDAQGHVVSFVKSSKAPDGVETVIRDISPASDATASAATPAASPAKEVVLDAERGRPLSSMTPSEKTMEKSPKRSPSPKIKVEDTPELASLVSPSKTEVQSIIEPAPQKEMSPKRSTSSASRNASPRRREKSPAFKATAQRKSVSPSRKLLTPEPLEDGEISETLTATAGTISAASVKVQAGSQNFTDEELAEIAEFFDTHELPPNVSRPVVADGRIVYQRDFLLTFSDVCTTAPPGMPPIDFFMEDAGSSSGRGSGASRTNSRQSSFGGASTGSKGSGRGTFQQASKGVGGGAAGGSGGAFGILPGSSRVASIRSSMEPPQRMGSRDGKRSGRAVGGGAANRNSSAFSSMPLPGTEGYMEPLKATEAGWTPDSLKKKVNYESEEAAMIAEIEKKVKGYLNKLTIEKFDAISAHFLKLQITDENILRRVINLIFDKALDEHYFQNMYGQLCLKLSNELPKVQAWIDLDAKNNIFRRLLLNKCQEEFENSEKWSKADSEEAESRQERIKRLHSMSAEEKERYAEDEYNRSKLKRRVLGNVTFIGELFKLNMITEKIMHGCVKQLLNDVQNPEEEETESLCKLMKSIGVRLDHERGRPFMDAYFARIQALSTNMVLPSRIRFMLQDLIELRKGNWKGRIEEAGPLKIADIHAAAEKKQREEEEARQRQSGGRRGDRDRRGGDRRQDRQNSGRVGYPMQQQDVRVSQTVVSSDGWSTVAERPGGRNNTRGGGGGSAAFDDGRADTKKPSSQLHLGPRGVKEKKDEVKPQQNQFSVFESLLTHSSDSLESVEPVSSPEVVSAVPKAEPVSREQAVKKYEGFIEEWFSIFDPNEVIAGHKELGTAEYNSQLLVHLLNVVLNKKESAVIKTSKLLVELAQAGCIVVDDVQKSFTELAEQLDDLAFDIPSVHQYFGQLYGALIAYDDTEYSFELLWRILEQGIETTWKKPPLAGVVASVCTTVLTLKGKEGLVDICARQRFDLKTFWPTAQRTEEVFSEWKAKHGLEFLDAATTTNAHDPDLLWHLTNEEPSRTTQWIASNFTDEMLGSIQFVRDLTSNVLQVVCSTTIFANGIESPEPLSRDLFALQENKIRSFSAVFEGVLHSRANRSSLELEVLNACQEYWNKTGAVETFLEHLFRFFITCGVVDVASALLWRDGEAGAADPIVRARALKDVGTYLDGL